MGLETPGGGEAESDLIETGSTGGGGGGCMDCRLAEWEQEACGEAVEEPTGKGVVCLAWGP